jgi:hypothetical protein
VSDPTRLEAASYKSVGPGTLQGLQVALMARMALVAAAFWTLETKVTGTERAPQVIDSQLPPMATPEAQRFPFIVVRLRSGADSPQAGDQHATAKAELVLGTYSDSDTGNADLRQLIDAIRLSLDAQPILEGTGFEHSGPLEWDLPDEQPRPLWLGVVTTNWTLPRPRRVDAPDPTEDGKWITA